MTRKDQIKSAYRQLGGSASFYDGMMTYSTLPGKAICRLVWNRDGEENLEYLTRALSGVPEDFTGKLLEVPVGTGVLTMPVYRELPDAEKKTMIPVFWNSSRIILRLLFLRIFQGETRAFFAQSHSACSNTLFTACPNRDRQRHMGHTTTNGAIWQVPPPQYKQRRRQAAL